MSKLLYKEMRLAANPLSYIFIVFTAMTFFPGYPILCSGFFVSFGIFQTYQQTREYDDIIYTALLPTKRKDVVSAKYLFTVIIQLVSFVLCTVFTVLRMTVMKDGIAYTTNQMMNANLLYLGLVLMIFAAFNIVFLGDFFKTAYKIAKPFFKFCAVAFSIILVGEALHHFPGLEYLNNTSGTSLFQNIVLVLGIVTYIVGTIWSLKKSIKSFEKIDL
ncbi:MAG: ABC-2 transporter permease [Acutalibacteraceae bacterium]|nr:ABC-2 transporter permease [Acutalibacteraceae bacterium]